MLRRLATGLGLAVLLAAPVVSDEGRTRAVAPDGTVYELVSGRAGDLFPGQEGPSADSSVLALDATRAGQARSRVLVPGTSDFGAETSYLLERDGNTGSIFVLYQGIYNGLHPLIRLAQWDGESWGELVDVVSSPFANKISPRMLLTRENAPEGPRTAIHIVWGEQAGDVRRTLHGLVLLDDGEYLGWAPVVDLAVLADAEAAEEPPGAEVAALYDATSGSHRRSMVVGFVAAQTGRLLTVEIELLPSALVGFAERLRGEIIGIGWRLLSAEAVEEAALAYDGGLNSAVQSYLAAHLANAVSREADELESQGDLVAFADRLRGEIIGIGSRVGAAAVDEPDATRIFEIGDTPEDTSARHLLKATVHLDLVPPQNVGADARLIVSPSADRVAIAWAVEGGLVFVQGSDEGWSDPATLDLEQLGLDVDAGFALVADEIGVR